MSGRDGPDSSAHSVSNGWDQEVALTRGERKFIESINKKYEDMEQRSAFFEKIHSTVKSIGKTVRPISEAILKKVMKQAMEITHSIEDSFMIATQPKLTEAIKDQNEKQKTLAQLEVAIFEHAFAYFNQDNNTIEITRENVKKYVEKNKHEIGNRIELAYKLFYELQNRTYQCDLSQKIMFIVHSLCQDVMDYTADKYTDPEIDKAIDDCLPQPSSDIMSESKGVVVGPESRGIGAREKLIHGPEDRWYIVTKNGKKRKIKDPTKYGLPTRRNIARLKKKAAKFTRKAWQM